ncbi:hypothetical protein SAMD00023353_7200110 [Rosellinia necatrix]|uniref:Uncharacterized protein n=1 Tax=Rosellinia necatrix TaxID=77044 RepID=A0A1W2TTN3_ROSNE|nr:hypothetical protein SAMD00023353_7200110 [Rosellinia necatrix]
MAPIPKVITETILPLLGEVANHVDLPGLQGAVNCLGILRCLYSFTTKIMQHRQAPQAPTAPQAPPVDATEDTQPIEPLTLARTRQPSGKIVTSGYDIEVIPKPGGGSTRRRTNWIAEF